MIHFIFVILMSIGMLHAAMGPNTNQYYGTSNANSKLSHRILGPKDNLGSKQWQNNIATQAGLSNVDAAAYVQSLISYFGLTVPELLRQSGSVLGPDVLIFGANDSVAGVIFNNNTSGSNISCINPTTGNPGIAIGSGAITVDLFSGTTNPPFSSTGVIPIFTNTATSADGIVIHGDVIVNGSLSLAAGAKLTITGNLYVLGQQNNYLSLGSGSTLTVGGNLLLDGGNSFGGSSGYSLIMNSTVSVAGTIIMINHYSSSATAVYLDGTISAGNNILIAENRCTSGMHYVLFCTPAMSMSSSDGDIAFISNSGTNGLRISGSVQAMSGEISFVTNSGVDAVSLNLCSVNAINVSFDSNSPGGSLSGNGVVLGSSGVLQVTGDINFNANIGGNGNISASGYGVKFSTGSTVTATGTIRLNGNQGGTSTDELIPAVPSSNYSGVYINSATFTAANVLFSGNISGTGASNTSGNGVELVSSSFSSPCYSFNNVATTNPGGAGFVYKGSSLTTQGATSTTKYTGPVPQVSRTQYLQYGNGSTAVAVTVNNSTLSSNLTSSPTSPIITGTGAAVAITAVAGSGTTAPSVSSGTTPTVSNTASASDGVTITGDLIIYGSLTLAASAKLTITGNLVIFGNTDDYLALGSSSQLIVQGSIILDGGNSYAGTSGNSLIVGSNISCIGKVSIQNHYSSGANAVQIAGFITTSNVVGLIINSSSGGTAAWIDSTGQILSNGCNIIANSSGSGTSVDIHGPINSADQVNVVANTSGTGTVVWVRAEVNADNVINFVSNNQTSSLAMDIQADMSAVDQINFIANNSGGAGLNINGAITTTGDDSTVNFIAHNTVSGTSIFIDGTAGAITGKNQVNFIANHTTADNSGIIINGNITGSATVNMITNSGGDDSDGLALNGTITVTDQANFVANRGGESIGGGAIGLVGTITANNQVNFIDNTGYHYAANLTGNIVTTADQGTINIVANNGNIYRGVVLNGGTFTAPKVINFIANGGAGDNSRGIYLQSNTITTASLNFIANLAWETFVPGLVGVLVNGDLMLSGSQLTIVAFIANRAGAILSDSFGVEISGTIQASSSFVASSVDSDGGTGGHGLLYNSTVYPTTAGLVYTGPIPPA